MNFCNEHYRSRDPREGKHINKIQQDVQAALAKL